MTRIQIPKTFISGFEIIVNLKETEITSIVSFLETIPVGIGPKRFSEFFSENWQDYKETQLPFTIYSLGSFKSSNLEDTSASNIAWLLCESFKEQTNNKYPVEEIDRLRSNLEVILSNSNKLAATFKAISLLSESSKVYREAHIISDIRLLFQSDLSDSQRNGLVIHQLKLEVEENGEKNEHYFSLNTADLLKLKIQIERAEEKELHIRSNYSNVISFIDITD